MWRLVLNYAKQHNRRLKPIGLILLLGSLVPAWSQGQLAVFASKDKVSLRWNQPAPLAEGFLVERRQPQNTTWTRLTPKPLTPIREGIRSLLGGVTDEYLAFFAGGQSLEQVLANPLSANLIRLLALRQPQVSLVLGEGFEDNALEPGARFQYRVLRVEPGGAETVWATSPKIATHGQADPVPLPKALAGKAGDARAALSWTVDPQQARTGVLIGCHVYRAQKPFGPFERVSLDPVIPMRINGQLPDHLYNDRFLQNGKSYWYRITGVNLVGSESQATQAILLTPKDARPPKPPSGLRALLLGSYVELSWEPVAAVDLFRIYRAPFGSKGYTRIDVEAVTSLEFIDTTVWPDQSYAYYVTAIDDSGNESSPSDAITYRRIDREPPGQPQNPRFIQEPQGLRILWDPVPATDLAGYVVERTTHTSKRDRARQVTGAFYNLNPNPILQTEYLDPLPARSQTTYAYRVVAVDKTGNKSPASATAFGRMPDKIAPAAPSFTNAFQEPSKIVLAWTTSLEEDVAGYHLYRSINTAPAVLLVTDLLPQTTTSYEDTTVLAGWKVVYNLTARDESGNESARGNPIGFTVLDLAIPESPHDLTIEIDGDGGFRLSWQPVSSPNLAAFLIYRNRGYRFFLLDEIDPTRPHYIDRGVKKGITYQYYLVSRGSNGKRGKPGNTVEATQ